MKLIFSRKHKYEKWFWVVYKDDEDSNLGSVVIDGYDNARYEPEGCERIFDLWFIKKLFALMSKQEGIEKNSPTCSSCQYMIFDGVPYNQLGCKKDKDKEEYLVPNTKACEKYKPKKKEVE